MIASGNELMEWNVLSILPFNELKGGNEGIFGFSKNEEASIILLFFWVYTDPMYKAEEYEDGRGV